MTQATRNRWRLNSRRSGQRSGRSIIAVLIFLSLFCGLLALVVLFYINPVLEQASHLSRTDPEQLRKRHAIAANAMLVLMLMLTLLVVGLLMTFRISRFFFPRPTPPRIRTKVIDAWAEAGKRLEEKKADE
jgi:predicted PurR-regulated permease PerM